MGGVIAAYLFVVALAAQTPGGAGQTRGLDGSAGFPAIFPDVPIRCEDSTAPYEGIQCTCITGSEDGAQQCAITAILWAGQGISGPLPAWVATDLPGLQILDLSFNSLTGPLPSSWFAPGAFPQLQQLHLRKNSLTGTLASQWPAFGGAPPPQLPVLRVLDLGHNAFSGSLPPARGLAGLEFLGLDHCGLTGSLPLDFLAGGDAAQIYLSGNQLSGVLPPVWAENGQLAASLRILMLDNNRLTGTLPASWESFNQLWLLGLHNNTLEGTVPLEWVRSWGSRVSEPKPQLGIGPGNPDMCGPAWTVEAESGTWVSVGSSQQAPEMSYSAAIFTPQATWQPWAVPWNISNGVCPGPELGCLQELMAYPALQLTNTLGSCAVACPTPTTAIVATNLYDLSVQQKMGLHALLRVNPDESAANMAGQEVQVPCWRSSKAAAAPQYLGGDMAFRQAAMSGQTTILRDRLLQVAGVVSTPPGQAVDGASYAADPGRLEEDGQPFWAVDLGVSVEVSLLLVMPGEQPTANTNISVYVGDDSSSVLANQLCLAGVRLEREGAPPEATPLLLPLNCRGRYVILFGDVDLADVQVYPSVADASRNKLMNGSDVELTNGDMTSCTTWDTPELGLGVADSGPVYAAIDLQYMAHVAAVTVLLRSPVTGLVVGLTNDSSLAVIPNNTCELDITALRPGMPTWFGSACVMMVTARYVVFLGQAASSVEMCGAQVFLAQAPELGAEEGESHSNVGIIVGATVGGLLGVAALVSCVACGVSYRAWRRTQRRHSKLAAQLAAAQASTASGSTVAANSKDGLIAAAALAAMTRDAPPRSELQLISTFMSWKLRRVHDSLGSWCLGCCAVPHEGAGDNASPTDSRSRLLLPLYYLSGRKRRGLEPGAGRSSQQITGSSAVVTAAAAGAGKEEDVEEGGGDRLPVSTQPSAPLSVQMSQRLSSQTLGGLLDYADIELGRFLGDGSFGSVHLARWKHVQVAVKILQRIDPKLLHAGSAGLGSKVTRSGLIAEQTLKELAKEASIMATLRHPCIVSYIGACLDPPCLVMEYCARGSVYGVLSGSSMDEQAARALTWPRLLRFAWDAAKGMLYLHTLRPPIIHRDLKSANLLVDANWHVKVSDFNLSRVMEPASVISTLSTANPRWMAPEVIHGEAPSLAADVFSFGTVLWELMTWELPWGSQKNPFQIANALVAGSRLQVPPSDKLPAGDLMVHDAYVDLMRSCWDQDPAARPTFDTIVKSLQVMVTKVVQASRNAL